jgi:hypothetical protein
LAKLDFDNRGTLGVGVAMGDNLNRFLKNLEKFRLSNWQIADIDQIVDKNFNL